MTLPPPTAVGDADDNPELRQYLAGCDNTELKQILNDPGCHPIVRAAAEQALEALVNGKREITPEQEAEIAAFAAHLASTPTAKLTVEEPPPAAAAESTLPPLNPGPRIAAAEFASYTQRAAARYDARYDAAIQQILGDRAAVAHYMEHVKAAAKVRRRSILSSALVLLIVLGMLAGSIDQAVTNTNLAWRAFNLVVAAIWAVTAVGGISQLRKAIAT
ncbi:MAG: hypothetical protein ABI112_17945 [Terracoccus sp.]